MIVLAIDTALDACSVAMADEAGVRTCISEKMQRGQSERLAPMVQEAMAAAEIRFDQVDRVAVTIGPGSFTGVRVGIAFARVMALALGKPCVGVSTLEALALEQGEGGLRAAIVRTPGAAYAALYEDGAPLLAPRAAEPEEAEELLSAAAGGRDFALRASSSAPLDIGALARRAARLDPVLYPPDPLYLRAPLKTMSEA